jgi:hypothetical protein
MLFFFSFLYFMILSKANNVEHRKVDFLVNNKYGKLFLYVSLNDLFFKILL